MLRRRVIIKLLGYSYVNGNWEIDSNPLRTMLYSMLAITILDSIIADLVSVVYNFELA